MKKEFKAALIINIVLTILGVACTGIEVITSARGIFIIKGFVNLCLFLVMVGYALWGYRKPHGNSLKYLMLTYAAYLLCYIYIAFLENSPLHGVVYAVVIGAVSYVAGRLNKINKNKIILYVAQIILLVTIISGILRNGTGLVNAIYRLNTCILFSDVIGAYLLRFSAHKGAGEAVPAEE